MKKLVIIPGGFHPFHAGHKALYDKAVEEFPTADVYVAATDDRSARPFPFAIKQKLAQLAGIPLHRFIQVKSPFGPDEITSHYPKDNTQLIFVKSEKNAKTGSDPEGPFPAERDPETGQLPLVTRGPRKGQPVSDWFQYYKRTGAQPMSQHGYLKYLPVHEFSGMTSGSEIRAKWPSYDDATKAQLINLMYPVTVGNNKLTDVTVKLMNQGIQGGNVSKSVPSQKNSKQPKNNTAVDEASLINDPERGIEIIPDGGMGTWNEDSLKSSLIAQFMDIAKMLKDGRYRSVEYSLYKTGSMASKIKALARLEDFKQKQGRRPIGRGRVIDIGESDYIDEN